MKQDTGAVSQTYISVTEEKLELIVTQIIRPYRFSVHFVYYT